LAKGTTGEGIGYGTAVGQKDVPVPSATNAQQTVEVEKEKVQFDFVQVTPHKK
jgi:hypothetical protein